MDVKILEKKDNKMTLQIDGIDPAFANALRRIMTNEIPTLAIEDVEFVENDSGFYDETLAHRLGLIPFKFDNLTSKGEVSIKLDKTGPCMVRSGDLETSVSGVVPTDPELPIIELLEGQKLKFNAVAKLGLGSEHAKWQPAVVGYRYFPIVKVKDKGDLAAAMKVCPQGVFGKKSDGSIGVVKSFNCDLNMRCTEVTDAVSISYDDTKFIFTIESVCGLSVEEIFSRALDILEEKSEDFIKAVKAEL